MAFCLLFVLCFFFFVFVLCFGFFGFCFCFCFFLCLFVCLFFGFGFWFLMFLFVCLFVCFALFFVLFCFAFCSLFIVSLLAYIKEIGKSFHLHNRSLHSRKLTIWSYIRYNNSTSMIWRPLLLESKGTSQKIAARFRLLTSRVLLQNNMAHHVN